MAQGDCERCEKVWSIRIWEGMKSRYLVAGVGRFPDFHERSNSFPVCTVDLYPSHGLVFWECVSLAYVRVVNAPLDDIFDIISIAALPHASQFLKRERWGDCVGKHEAIAGLLSVTEVAEKGVHLGRLKLVTVLSGPGWMWFAGEKPVARNGCVDARKDSRWIPGNLPLTAWFMRNEILLLLMSSPR